MFLHAQPSKTVPTPQESMVAITRKGRTRLHSLAGCDFACIYMPLETTKELEFLLQNNDNLQFTLDSYPGKISIPFPGHKLFKSKFHFVPKFIQSRAPPEAVIVFTDGSGLLISQF